MIVRLIGALTGWISSLSSDQVRHARYAVVCRCEDALTQPLGVTFSASCWPPALSFASYGTSCAHPRYPKRHSGGAVRPFVLVVLCCWLDLTLSHRVGFTFACWQTTCDARSARKRNAERPQRERQRPRPRPRAWRLARPPTSRTRTLTTTTTIVNRSVCTCSQWACPLG